MRSSAADLWTGCYTPRELRLLLAAGGFVVDSISSVEPGAYGSDLPTIESPEYLVIAHRAARTSRISVAERPEAATFRVDRGEALAVRAGH